MQAGFFRKQRGVALVEFALVSLFIFFPLLLGMIEFGRAIYLWNTLQEVTRHAARDAAVTDFTNAGAMNTVRQNAIIIRRAGTLPAGREISDASIAIDYLNGDMGVVAEDATCPPKNVTTCVADPDDPTCIRFVRARICQPGTDCTPVQFVPITGWFSFLNIDMPASDTIIPAESLGYRPNALPC